MCKRWRKKIMLTIILDSVDKTGKTTLIRELHKKTNYKYPILDRFTPSSITYGHYRNRDLDYSEYYEIEKKFADDVILFYITASNDSIEKRIVSENEKDITFKDIQGLKNEYMKYLYSTMFSYFIIDTTDRSIEECVDEILYDLKEFEDRDGIYQICNLCSNVEKHGNSINGTKELTNISINFKDITLEALKNYCSNNKIDFNETNENESFYYDRVFYSLKHIIKAQLTEHGQNINSRRFIYTSDECINSFHLLFRKNTLEVFINLRSSNVKKILPFDVYYCKIIVNELNRQFFKAEKVNCNFTINSAHFYI